MSDTYRYHFIVNRQIAYSGLTRNVERSKIELRKKFGGGHILVLRGPSELVDGLEWERRQTRLGRPTRRNIRQQQRMGAA